jgi:hypothetical protein
MLLLLQPEILWHVKSIPGFMPRGQPRLIRRLQGIPTPDYSTTKGHYTSFNLAFKVSIRVYNSASNCYHGCLYEEKFWLYSFLKVMSYI